MKRVTLRITALLLAAMLALPGAAMAFIVDKLDLNAADFQMTPPQSLVYDGAKKTVTVTAINNYKGQIKVLYNGNEEEPVNAGEYLVTIDCGGDDMYNRVQGLYISKFTIEKAVPMVEAPTGLTAYVGQTFGEVALPEGWTFDAPDFQVLDAPGVLMVTVWYWPEDATNYEPVSFPVVPLTVLERPATPPPAPTAEPEVPATGDDANLSVLLTAMLLAGAAMLLLRRRVRG